MKYNEKGVIISQEKTETSKILYKCSAKSKNTYQSPVEWKGSITSCKTALMWAGLRYPTFSSEPSPGQSAQSYQQPSPIS